MNTWPHAAPHDAPHAAHHAAPHDAPHDAHHAAHHAERLLRWYPLAWRERYGVEFMELLMEDCAERPHSTSRTADVVANGVMARLSYAGLTGSVLEGTDQARASLAALICSVAAFLTLGVSMWSQLMIGWQWSEPDSPGTAVAVVAMTIAVAVFAALALCATLPVVWTVVRRMAGDGRAPLGRSGSGPRRSRRLQLGLHPVHHVVLGASHSLVDLPAFGAVLDAREPGRNGDRGRGIGQNRAAGAPE